MDTEPTKQREGDQPLPIVNELPFIQDQVIADIEERKQVGIKRYGTPLQAHNGRDALQDAYEEALDLCMYLKQMIVERDNPKAHGITGMFTVADVRQADLVIVDGIVTKNRWGLAGQKVSIPNGCYRLTFA